MPAEAATEGSVSRPPSTGPARGRWSGSEWQRLAFTARPLPLLLAITWILHRSDGLPDRVVRQTDRHQAIIEALRLRSIVTRREDVHFVTPTRPLLDSFVERERALVRGANPGEPSDIYLVDSLRSPEGHLIDVTGLYNLTRTSAADEQQLIVEADRASWVIAQDGAFSSVILMDLKGEPAPAGKGWPRLARVQNALTNYQETGQFEGIGRRMFKLMPAAYRVVLGFSKSALLIDADAHKIRIPTEYGPIEGDRWVIDQTPKKARPGNLVTWAVDRVRAVSWLGDEGLVWVKAVAFQGVDQFEQIVGSVTGDDGSESAAEELGELYAAPAEVATNPEIGWPPLPMDPMLNPPLKGEGKWVSVSGFPFLLQNPGAPSPFVVSFIRTDRQRKYSQVFVTLWDPRQIELDTVSGTVEPISATGATGTGVVPRDPKVLSRMVGAFNGGFQAVHGEFGMMADRVVYLPPKPYGATVARLADGSTGFGTWPEDLNVPESVLSFRQNMTPLIVGDQINPYKRHWWGGLPPGWTQESRTVRSGLCMTKEGFAGYFYGASIDHEVLALAMQRSRCTYGIHLDMNAGHTGLEFYRVGPKASLPAPKRVLEDAWEAQGTVPDKPGWNFMARRMIRGMALMNFPRYINAEARDFFYLTLRHLLPGEPIKPAVPPIEEGEGNWRTQGLPQHGWPYAVATTNFRPDPARPYARVGVIKLDPKFLRVERLGDLQASRVIEFRSILLDAPLMLWHSEAGGFAIAPTPPVPGAIRVTGGLAPDAVGASRAQAALGIDQAGMLLYVRVTEGPAPGEDAAFLIALLDRLRCSQKLLLPRPLGAIFADRDTGTQESPAASQSSDSPPIDRTRFVRADGPNARQIFADTPIVLPKRWAILQHQRVRYK